jgi:hypothetical protein
MNDEVMIDAKSLQSLAFEERNHFGMPFLGQPHGLAQKNADLDNKHHASGSIYPEVRLHNDIAWQTHRKMADLFQNNGRTINEYIGNTYSQQRAGPRACPYDAYMGGECWG